MTAPLVSTTDRPYQLLPPLDMHQRELLRQSIKANGVLEPVVFDEDGEILDGHHRVEIAEELGIEYPRRVIDDLDRPGKHAYALTVNVARRQLDQAARSGLVAQLRIRGMSIRQIAEATGLPKSTVSDDIRQLSEAGQLSQPERIVGADGKGRPATRPAPQPTQTPEPVEPVDAPNVAAGSGPTPPKAADAPTAEQAERLPGAILSVLRDAAGPMAVVEIWAKLPMASVRSAWVLSALTALVDAGLVDPAGRARYGNQMVELWQLAETPGSAEAPSTAPADSGSTSPEPEPPSGDLRDQVLAVLRPEEDDALGLDDVCERLPGFGEPGQARPGEVRTVLADLVEAGVARVGTDEDGPFWWKAAPKPTRPDPVASVAAALDKHVPDPDAPKRAWRKELLSRVTPLHEFALWLKVDDAAQFADEHDVETLRQLAIQFDSLHRRVVAARTATVTPLRRIK